MLRRTVLFLLLCALVPLDLIAQVRASELASVSQTVDGTVISLEYSRPRIRGRKAVFGDEVKWLEVWTPGANWATTLDLTKDAQINKHAVPKGKYTVWMVVRKDKPWTFVLDPRPKLFHVAHPDSAANQIRFDVATVAAPRAEVLSWSFPGVSITGTTLLMHWDTVSVPLQIDITPSYAKITADKAKDFLGQYLFKWAEGDSVEYTITLTHDKGDIYGNWSPEPWPGANPFMMLSKSGDVFLPGFMQDGELYEVAADLATEFKRKNGKVTGFEMRNSKDKLQASAQRK